MRTRVKIQFLRNDIFKKYFMIEENTPPNDPKIVGIGTDWIVFNDDVENNDDYTAKHNALTYINAIIEKDELFESKELRLMHDDKFKPFAIWVHLKNHEGRTVCIIVDTEIVSI